MNTIRLAALPPFRDASHLFAHDPTIDKTGPMAQLIDRFTG